MLVNNTRYAWSIALHNTNTGEVVSSNRIAADSDMKSFVMSVVTLCGLRRYREVTITDDGVYFDGVLSGRRLGGIITVKFLDSPMQAKFTLVR